MLEKRQGPDLYHHNNKDEYVKGPNPKMRGFYDGGQLTGDCTHLRGKCIYLRGDCTGLSGDCDGGQLTGDCTNLTGDITGMRGNCTGVMGNLDECNLSALDREKGVFIKYLISDGSW